MVNLLNKPENPNGAESPDSGPPPPTIKDPSQLRFNLSNLKLPSNPEFLSNVS